MDSRLSGLIEKLGTRHSLSRDEYAELLRLRDGDSARELASRAVELRQQIYGKRVFIRGLIELSNIDRKSVV